MSLAQLSLDFDSLRAAYESGADRHEVIDEVCSRIDRDSAGGRVQNAWICRASRAEMHVALDRAMARRRTGADAPLLGIPFGVKDNIDVAGVPTTVACPAFARVPDASAPVVTRLVEAGAVFVGKTNLDQFASGLVGVRSPYGVPTNPFDARMIPGGSSSGSAVAVAAGHVAFALGSDTAGSGRVPAAFNNVVGLKPSCGVLSARGLVPACRSIDCVSVFALTVGDACAVANVAKGWDPGDPFARARERPLTFDPRAEPGPWRIGVPSRPELVFFDDPRARAVFEQAVLRLLGQKCEIVEIDFKPFRQAGELLYGGPWVAERLVAAGHLLDTRPDAFLPVTAEILREGKRFSALDAYQANVNLAALRQLSEATWSQVDALLVPTTPTIYRVDEVLANPRALNANLGVYTTFTNLMDLAAVAVPSGFREDGLPAGITFLGPRASDSRLASIALRAHEALGETMGATGHPLTPSCDAPASRRRPVSSAAASTARRVSLVVVGAHLSGQPLNHQLTGLGATRVRGGATAPRYRLFALAGTTPPKPGLVRVREGGVAVEVEVWSLEEAAFGAFVAAVRQPLCIGSIELDDGALTPGFLCEPDGLAGAVDISEHGGWRAYLSRAPRSVPG